MKLVKRFSVLFSFFIILISLVCFTALAQDSGVKVYRLYNPNTSEHLYTTSEVEYESLLDIDWINEGIGWYAPDNGEPVWRLYNPDLSNHLYTTNIDEIEKLLEKENWLVDNDGYPVFYSGGSINIYRLYNPKLNSLHHLTSSESEYESLPDLGWRQEDITIQAVGYGEPVEPTGYSETNGYSETTGNFVEAQGSLASGFEKLQSEYPQGMHYSFEKNYTSSVLGSGNACHAFALMASDMLFGDAPAHQHTDINNIKVGDLIRYRSYSGGYVHSVIAMSVNGHQITVAEGNWLRSVNYGRVLDLDSRDNSLIYISTRY